MKRQTCGLLCAAAGLALMSGPACGQPGTEVSAERGLRATVTELTLLCGRMREAVDRLYQRLQREDADHKDRIARGVWPTAEKPDKSAKFVPRLDVEAPALAVSPAPDLAGLGVAGLFARCVTLEEEARALYERFQVLSLVALPRGGPPLSHALKNTRLVAATRPTGLQDAAEAWRQAEAMLLTVERWGRSMAPPAVPEHRIRQFIKDLDADDLSVRDRAAKDIIQIGPPALPLVREALKGPASAEVERRCKDIVKTIEWRQALEVPDGPFDRSGYDGHFLNPALRKPLNLRRLMDPPVKLGNRIIAGMCEAADPCSWISLEQWYFVGPFTQRDSSQRPAEQDRQFAPEALVDLGSVYEGPDGRRLRWKYRSIGEDFLAKGVRIQPYVVDSAGFGIWYFYAFVWCHQDMEVLASFAADDWGACWVNGRQVWRSPPEAQPWAPFTEHSFRTVKLRQGINRVLFKLENARGSADLSLILMTFTEENLIRAVGCRRG